MALLSIFQALKSALQRHPRAPACGSPQGDIWEAKSEGKPSTLHHYCPKKLSPNSHECSQGCTGWSCANKDLQGSTSQGVPISKPCFLPDSWPKSGDVICNAPNLKGMGVPRGTKYPPRATLQGEHCCCHNILATTNTSKLVFTVEISVPSGGQSEIRLRCPGGAVGTHWALA